MLVFKKLGLFALASLLMLSSLAITPVQARDGQITTGVIGGLAAGALLGATVAGGNRGYYYEEGYAPSCWVEKRPAYDAYGNFLGYRRQRVCDGY